MYYKLITEPTILPLTLQEVKDHLRMVYSVEDTSALSYLQAATDTVQNYTWRPLMKQSWQLVIDSVDLANKDIIYINRAPVISIESIQYYNQSSTLTTLDPSSYETDVAGDPARIRIKTMPTVRDRFNAMLINFTCGYAEDIGEPKVCSEVSISTKTFTLADHGLNNNSVVTLVSAGTVTGLLYDSMYYVTNRTPDTFQLSDVPNGSAITITGTEETASTFQQIKAVPPAIKSALKLIIGHLFEHREDVIIGTIVQKLDMNSQYLLEPFVNKVNYPL